MDMHDNPLIRGWCFSPRWTAVDAFSDGMDAKTDRKQVMLRSIFCSMTAIESDALGILSGHFPALTTCSFDSDSVRRQTGFPLQKEAQT